LPNDFGYPKGAKIKKLTKDSKKETMRLKM
jgi:hypothetical protein